MATLLSLLLWTYNITIPSLKKDVTIAKQETQQHKDALEYKNSTLLRESKKYDDKLKELPKEIEKITTRYVAVYQTIDNFIKDENETDCNASYRMLSTFNY